MLRRMVKHALVVAALVGVLAGAYAWGRYHEARSCNEAMSYLAGELDKANAQARRATARADRLANRLAMELR